MKELCLGTAMWGWSVSKESAFLILDCFYEQGGRYVDTATNYPLNGNILDYKKAVEILSEWCEKRIINDLKITCKIGSVSNSNTPENNLKSEVLIQQYNWLTKLFGTNLHCIMLHWDERNSVEDINDTINILNTLEAKNVEFGLSGIKHVETYMKALDGKFMHGLNVQIKHNFLHSSLNDYKALWSLSPKYWAYGISVSGLKLFSKDYNESSYVSLVRGDNYHENMLSEKLKLAICSCIEQNDCLENIYHVAMAYAENDTRLEGYIVAPSTLEQMKDIFNIFKLLSSESINLSFLDGKY
jgi:aryl-alcohol dehydrogenase-like predicted oxidoreductase